MARTVTLNEAAEILREQGIVIRIGTFPELGDFRSYFEQHYLPWLNGEKGPVPRFLQENLRHLFE